MIFAKNQTRPKAMLSLTLILQQSKPNQNFIRVASHNQMMVSATLGSQLINN
jgi:hypothetical protein